MTELSTESVAVQTAVTEPPPPPEAQTSAAKDVKEVGHTPGGWPVVPLAMTGANTTVGTIAAAGLAGGPIAAAVAATGMAVLGTVASYRSRNPRPKQAARRAAARTVARNHAARHRSGGLTATGRTTGGSGRVPGQKRRVTGTGLGRGGAGQGRAGAGKNRAPVSLNKPAMSKGRGGAAGAVRKAGQVKALRNAQKQAGASRAQKRERATAARRAVADARRNAAKPNKPLTGDKSAGKARSAGLAGRMLGGVGRKARAVKQAAIAKQRARKDEATTRKVAGQRAGVRKAPARQAARKALLRSAARFHRRRALAALLALPIGVLGFLSSPLGRRFGLPWLVYPGRRLYRRLSGTARDQRAERDAAIREARAAAEAAAEEEATKDASGGLGGQVDRPAERVPENTNTSSSEGEHVSGFQFEEHAAEMEQAAQSYDPEDCMEILAMVEGLPEALTSVANTLRILAERSDQGGGDFALEKEVASGFNEIFQALMAAVSTAEDLGPTFRQVHEQDIARHEDPRNGPEAEKGWNV
ncbi:hypothetical protein ABZ845_04140 [Streptomyces sp. NPDC047022]|uniref:hypothetical protein n=1 Tax=Streptomyces sp. NPDC047022 TaxID=3155737 RepID=UPI0033CC44D3